MSMGARPSIFSLGHLSPGEAETRGAVWIVIAGAVQSINAWLILPTAFGYVESMRGTPTVYAMTIGSFYLGRLCFSVPMGRWSDQHGFREAFAITWVIAAAGGVLYALAGAWQCRWLALIGRFINGCGSSGPLSAWITRACDPDRRIQLQSLLLISQIFGTIAGPGSNLLMVFLSVKIDWFYLDSHTWGGYFPALLNSVMLIAFFYRVDEPPHVAASRVVDSRPWKRMFVTGRWLCPFLGLCTNFQAMAFASILAPIARPHWGSVEIMLSFTGLAVLSAIGVAFSMFFDCGGADPMWLVLIGGFLNLLSTTVTVVASWGAPDDANIGFFIAAGAAMTFSVFLYNGPTYALYQCTCGDEQGLLDGVFQMAKASGRICGAALAGAFLNNVDPWVFSTALLAPLALSILLQCVLWSRLAKALRDTRSVYAGVILDFARPISPDRGATPIRGLSLVGPE